MPQTTINSAEQKLEVINCAFLFILYLESKGRRVNNDRTGSFYTACGGTIENRNAPPPSVIAQKMRRQQERADLQLNFVVKSRSKFGRLTHAGAN